MECPRTKINLKLVTNPIRATKLIARPTFQRFDIIHKNVTSITAMEDKVLLNRPIYLGFSILDLSNITMYRFHYQPIIAKYGSKAKLAYTDTDSFAYWIETKIIYDDMAANISAFDTSKYPKTHQLQSRKDAETLGSFRMSVIFFSHTNYRTSKQDVFSEASTQSYQDRSQGCFKIPCTKEFEPQRLLPHPRINRSVQHYIQNYNITSACCQNSRS